MNTDNMTIVTELLRLVQDIDKKVSTYKEEIHTQSERLSEIERKLEELMERPDCSTVKESLFKRIVGKI